MSGGRLRWTRCRLGGKGGFRLVPVEGAAFTGVVTTLVELGDDGQPVNPSSFGVRSERVSMLADFTVKLTKVKEAANGSSVFVVHRWSEALHELEDGEFRSQLKSQWEHMEMEDAL